MANQAPPIDRRTETEIAAQVRQLLTTYAPGWQEFDTASGQPRGVSRALIGVFARYAALVIQRLNQAPDKNLLAFLDLLGATLLPPEPARVPLTFFLAAGGVADAVVPAGTQVAAPPAEGEQEPVIFETERELIVTAAQLASLMVRDPALDQWADLKAILGTPADAGEPAFGGRRAGQHLLYIASDSLLSYPALSQLRLTIGLQQNLPAQADPRAVRWELWDGATWNPVPAGSISVSDGTANLTRSGPVAIGPLAQTAPVAVASSSRRWLRARLATPIAPDGPSPRSGMVRAGQLPVIQSVTLQADVNRAGLPVEGAFANALPLDLGKDFFPLGERPRFGDALYLASAEAFSQAGAVVTLRIRLTDPTASGKTPKNDGGATLAWEYWDGGGWALLGTSRVDGVVTGRVTGDSTKAFTASAGNPAVLDGVVTFSFPPAPAAPAQATINGVTSYWIRARLGGGNYGVEASYTSSGNPPVWNFVPETFRPPSIAKVTVDYAVTKTAAPDAILIGDDHDAWAPVAPFMPFQPPPGDRPSLYHGFTLPPNRAAFPNRTLSLYYRVADRRHGERSTPISPERSVRSGDPGEQIAHTFVVTNDTPAPVEFAAEVLGARWASSVDLPAVSLAAGASQPLHVQATIPPNAPAGGSDRGWLRLKAAGDPALGYNAEFTTFSGSQAPANLPARLAWEYWNGSRWSKLLVNDETEGLTRSGLVQFLPPADFVSSTEFGARQYWVRARWDGGDYPAMPRLRAVWLNTTTAGQTLTLTNETLGSSNGSANQTFRTTRAPVLQAPHLQVREPELPPTGERAALEAVEGADAVSVAVDAAGRPGDIWVRWRQTPDFYGSGPRDRHYVLDHLTGEIRFGDGQNGLIPPAGAGNIRLARYQTGGGAAGNRAAATIAQLKTTVPYVDKVINYEAASKGANAETLDSLVARAPKTIRHRQRAVTLEDYQDLAALASPEVARAKCVPLFDLAADPDALRQLPGVVSVIVVPRAADPKPLASLELLARVQSYLDAHRLATVDLVVVGPDYVRVDVQVQIALKSLDVASAVEAEVTAALHTFLHPLTGGTGGAGWDFGRQPHESDVYALLEAIPGVDHVHTLSLSSTPDRPGADQTDRFLVYAGAITTTLIYEES